MSSAIWNAIPRRQAVLAASAAEQARRLEQLPGLERAPLEVVLDRRVRVVALAPLHRLAARERERRVGEHGDALGVAVSASTAKARAKR